MKTAFILLSFGEYDGDDGVNPLPNEHISSVKRLRELPYVEEAHPLFGEFDVIVKIKAEDYNALGERLQDIRKIKGVYDYKLLTGIEPEEFAKK